MTNPAYTPTELAHIVALCEPQVVVCLPGAGGENNIRAACATSGILVSEILFVEPDEEAYGLRKKVEVGPKSWMTLLSNEELNVELTVLGVFSNRWLVFKIFFFLDYRRHGSQGRSAPLDLRLVGINNASLSDVFQVQRESPKAP